MDIKNILEYFVYCLLFYFFVKYLIKQLGSKIIDKITDSVVFALVGNFDKNNKIKKTKKDYNKTKSKQNLVDVEIVSEPNVEQEIEQEMPVVVGVKVDVVGKFTEKIAVDLAQKLQAQMEVMKQSGKKKIGIHQLNESVRTKGGGRGRSVF